MASSRNPSSRARSHIWLVVVFVFVVQFALIFWLGERHPPEPRPAEPAPGLHFAGGGCAELLEILDPTLFALPHVKGFSGAGWLIPPVQEMQPFAWSEPPRWLELPVARLGTALGDSIATAHFEPLPALTRLEPEPLLARISESGTFPDRSSLQLAGDLAARPLLTTFDLPSWPHNDLVSNSVVQLVVDADGLPFSFTLLERSGHEPADKQALKQARMSRFAPLGQGDHARAGDLAWGTLIFQWHTLPAPPAAASVERSP
jgi:hypothetical protein